MEFIARHFDDVPPARHGRLVVDHVDSGVVNEVLPLS
jgi:hypothetical protein